MVPETVTRYPASQGKPRYQKYRIAAEGEIELSGYFMRDVKETVRLVVDGVPIEDAKVTVRRLSPDVEV